MNERVKRLWTAALRGGSYQQGHHTLRAITFGAPYDCCLGVLCDLYRIEHPEAAEWLRDGSFTLGDATEDDGTPIEYCEVLPPVVGSWAGLAEADPKLGRLTASEHNDGDARGLSKSFAEIADLIEAHL